MRILASPNRWIPSPVAYTRTSDSTFTVTDNTINAALFVAGTPLRYRPAGGTWRYGIVKSYSSGTVTLCGVAFTTSESADLHLGVPELVRVVQWTIPGNVIVADPYGASVYWQTGAAYCVRTTWKADTAPVGSAITANLKIAGSAIHASNISITAGSTAEFDSAVNINESNYDVQFGETLAPLIAQIGSSTPGGNPLTVTATLILK